MIEQLACTTCEPAHVLPLLPIRGDGHLIADRLSGEAACGAMIQELDAAHYFVGEGGRGWRYGTRADLSCPDCLATLPRLPVG